MESYLSGRNPDADPSRDNASKPFRPYASVDADGSPHLSGSSSLGDETVETLHDEPGGPKVEVVSVAGRVNRIVVHLENGKVLNLHCEY